MITLKNLLENIDFEFPGDCDSIKINKVHYDSRKIAKGDLFTAVRGFQVDGHDYLGAVAKAGATAAVVERINTEIPLKQIKVTNTRSAMGLIAYNYYKEAIEKLTLIGITGTNGKTTTSYLMHSILENAGISSGLAGTIQYIIGNDTVEAWNTTPEALDLYEMLSKMQTKGNTHGVLEVSSHALSLHRVQGLQFKAAVFTNLSRDHMDFYSNMDEYFTDKVKLFSQLTPDGTAVLNGDDRYGNKIETDNKKLFYGLQNNADVFVKDWKTSAAGTYLNVVTPAGDIEVNASLIGDFNVYNILAAITVGIALKIPISKIKVGIENIRSVPGRLETYTLSNGALVVVDYAHTPDALEKVLQTLRKISKNELYVVFGCGGDRDKGKRPLMGKIAEQLADKVYVTDDNPRTEESQSIINDILEGMQKSDSVYVIPKREKAIRMAIMDATLGDIILVAGKGHETYQVIGKQKHKFDEASIIREAAKDA